jgi:hypothetical protein
MKKICFLFVFFMLLGCLNQPKKEVSQEEINAQIEAARKTDSLLNSSKKVMENKNLTQSFMGIHNHLMGSGNLAFDAHQDPIKTRRMIRNYAKLAERHKEYAPKIEEARRKMLEAYRKSAKEEEARIY